MDVNYEINGTSFVWDKAKSRLNLNKHGVSFETAASAFFDPFFRLEDASRNNEQRDAIIGFDDTQRLLYVVHIEIEGEFIRIISAHRATTAERFKYDQ
jgi:uncharacterized DUF497 family protein